MNQLPQLIQKNVNLGLLTTYKIGGVAQFFTQVDSLEELSQVISWAKNRPIYFLGGGSNLLISDQGVDGLVISLTPQVPVFSGSSAEVGAGYGLSKLVQDCIDQELAGLEGLAGIPGQVGGAVRGNAGAFGSWIADRITEVVAYNFKKEEVEIFSVTDCQFDYRHSRFKDQPELLVWSVKLSLLPGSRVELQAKYEHHLNYRRQNHPTLPSAGCVFKNPLAGEVAKNSPELWQLIKSAGLDNRQEVPAGFVIEQAGLSGYSVGSAQVSLKHANFLVNNGQATAQQMKQLIKQVETVVQDKYNLTLVNEIAFWP